MLGRSSFLFLVPQGTKAAPEDSNHVSTNSDSLTSIPAFRAEVSSVVDLTNEWELYKSNSMNIRLLVCYVP